MKKYLISAFIFTVLITLLTTSAIADDEAFYTALQRCTPYSSSGQTTTDGVVVNFQSRIIGKDQDKCIYEEKVSFSGINSCTKCRLSQKQIDELVNVMRAYSTVQRYSGETPDTSSLQNVSNNPVVKVWNKYLMDSSVCTVELSQ